MSANRQLRPLVAIIGGGPAGMSAALWCKQLRLMPMLIDAGPVLGGMQRLNWHPNHWVLGHTDLSGQALAERYQEHILKEGIPYHCHTQLVALSALGPRWQCQLETAAPHSTTPQHWQIDAEAVILCLGTRFKRDEDFTPLPGYAAAANEGTITIGPPDAAHIEQMRGRHVALIGGGDNAFEHALFLLRAGAHVQLIIRTEPTAQHWLQQEVLHHPDHAGRVSLLTQAPVQGFSPAQGKLALHTARGQIVVDHAFALLGYRPNSDALARMVPQLALDNKGYIVTDRDNRTSLPGLYAAGDIIQPHHPCVVTALGSGSIAARTVERDLRQRFAHMSHMEIL